MNGWGTPDSDTNKAMERIKRRKPCIVCSGMVPLSMNGGSRICNKISCKEKYKKYKNDRV